MSNMEQWEQDIVELQEKKQKALERAANATRSSDVERWKDAAERYDRMIELKRAAIERQKRVDKIKADLEAAKNAGGGGTVSGGGGGGGGGVVPPPAGSNYTPPPVSPTPPAPPPPAPPPPPPPVKVAPIDTIVFDSAFLPVNTINDLIFENISGTEIINIARNDIVNGQKVIYQPIRNLSGIQRQYNPFNIVALQSTSDKYFLNFAIKLDERTPFEGNGPNGEYVYFNSKNGDIVVEAVNLQDDEQIEVQIITDGTIYEAEL